MRTAGYPEPGNFNLPLQRAGACQHPPLIAVADLLTWGSAPFTPLSWRDAFDALLERRANELFVRSEADSCLAQGLALLPPGKRRRFLRAPIVSALLLRRRRDRRPAEEEFDGRFLAGLLVAELAAEGFPVQLPASCWTARGDRFLDRSARELWVVPGASLENTDIVIDESSPFQFPGDELGMGETVPHDPLEQELVEGRLSDAIRLLRRSCASALNLVTVGVEVLALRRAPAQAHAFYSSTFWGYAGLVRLANAYLPEADTAALAEALVHEAIHCILQVHEELEAPFVRMADAKCVKIVSPWTGVTIQLQSYVHACIVWYGVYRLWSTIGPGEGVTEARIEALKRRARAGFRSRPVGVGLAPFDHLLSESLRGLLRELEERMVF